MENSETSEIWEISEKLFRVFLFSSFPFCPIAKIENSDLKTSEKNFRVSRVFDLARSKVCRCIFSFLKSVYRRMGMQITSGQSLNVLISYIYVLFKDNITQQIKNMGNASTPKRKLMTKMFHVHSFVVLFSYIFLLWHFKILIERFFVNSI